MGTQGIERVSQVYGEWWMLLIILLCMMMLAYVHHVYPSRFTKLFKATFNERITRQVMREEMVFSHRASWFLLAVSAIAFALATALSYGIYKQADSVSPSVFLYILLAVIAIVLLRQILRSGIAALLHSDMGLREYNFVSALIYKVLGFILLPIALLISYLDKPQASRLLLVFAVVVFIGVVYRLIRGWIIGRHYNKRLFYVIFYLCALELLPTLLMVKALSSNLQF